MAHTLLHLLRLEEQAGQVEVVRVETELHQAQQLLARRILAVVAAAALIQEPSLLAQQAAPAS